MDELMWFIAEEGDHSAVEGFIKRYPEHRAEMIKRVNLVREMRGARPELASTSEKSAHFQPRAEIRHLANPRPKPLVAAGGLALVASLAWAGYAILSPRVKVPANSTAVVRQMPEKPTATDPRQDPDYNPNQNVVPPTPPAPAPKAAYEELVTIESDNQSLISVLNQISFQTGLRIEMGPGMPNPNVEGMYAGMRAIDVLRDLGTKYGFSVFDQEADHVLLIPAVDVNATRETQSPPETSNGETTENSRNPSLPQVSDGTN